MRVSLGRTVILMLCMLLFTPFLVNASWQTDACSLENTGCSIASSGFNEPFCVSSKVDYAGTCIWPALTNNLSSIQDKRTSLSSYEIRDLLSQYCNSVLGDGAHGRIYYAKPSLVSDSWDWQQTFDSHQSLFVYALCSSFKDGDGKSPFVPDGGDIVSKAFKDGDLVDILKLQQRSKRNNLCSLSYDASLSDCDMSVYATEIFGSLMSDIFKIKYAQVLQVNTVKNFEAKTNERVQAFFSGYYKIIDKYEVLTAIFPQTIDVLESNQKYYMKVLDSVKVINNSDLAKMVEDSGCPVSGNMVGTDFIACALHSTQGNGMAIEPSFVTMFYNEILNYRIFMNYYTLRTNEKIKAMSRDRRNEKDIRIYESKSSDFEGYADIQIDSAKFALRGLEDFSMTYPLHIGLLLYQEKEKTYRDKYLSPIVTIFYSLSEKLKNVQLPN